ncbi:hypothetical protein [uncultured Gimesia sp.]|uniref:hypothetical protein n=1 Tax=uncultured Gimesia sp. TaxID=1678688 RepID=UPI0026033536|nr:hypothetical protein [uncultured Gimesia sp.]
MKFRSRWPLALLLLLFLVLASRLLWTLGVSADSWKLLGDEGSAQIRSLYNWEIPVSYRTPAEQADFWIQQSKENEAAQLDPQVALGAAWMLDTPRKLYQLRHYATTRFDKRSLYYLLIIDREWDHETVEAMEDDFEPQAREACLEQSKLATQLDPENKYLWRNRALLLFQLQKTQQQPIKLIPRQQDWQAVLDECTRHDPENALYDYLAALHLWSISSEIKPDSPQINILDPSQYQQSRQKLNAGLQKKFLDTGYTGEAATLAFLSQIGISINYQISMAESRKGRTREQLILVELLLMLQKEFNSAANQKHYSAAAAEARRNLSISEQLVTDHSYLYLTDLKLLLRINGLVDLLKLQEEDPGILNPAEYEAFSKEYSQALLTQNINTEVLKRIEQRAPSNDTPQYFRLALLSATSLNLIFISLVCALVAGGISWSGRSDPNSEFVEMGFWRPLVCWLLGAGMSLLVWGLFPAQIVPLQLQWRALQWIYWIGYLLFVLGFLYLIHAGFSVPWPQIFSLSFFMSIPVLIVSQYTDLYQWWFQTPVATIVAIAAVMLLFGVLSLRFSRKFFSEKRHSQSASFYIGGLILLLAAITVPYGLNLARVYQIPVNLTDPIYPVTWRNILGLYAVPGIPENYFSLYSQTATQVCLIWYWLAGEIIATLISLSILCLWYLKRQSRFITGGFPKLLQTRKRIVLNHAGRMLAKSCAVTALLFALIYLAVAPGLLQSSEKQILRNYQKLTDSKTDQAETRAIQAEIEADPSTMARLRSMAEKSKQRFTEQKIQQEPST